MTFVASDASIDCSPSTLAMIERQANAWTVGDFSKAVDDWHPQGILSAPGNRILLSQLGRTVEKFFHDYGELRITITNVFASADGRRVALEWHWEVTRRRDGSRSLTEDAILIDLDEDGRILSWREYFDTANAVEDYHKSRNTPSGDHHSP
jgi:hypothetical protein